MKRTGTINNALNMRGLQELPPPFSGLNRYGDVVGESENIGTSKYKRI